MLIIPRVEEMFWLGLLINAVSISCIFPAMQLTTTRAARSSARNPYRASEKKDCFDFKVNACLIPYFGDDADRRKATRREQE